MVVMFPVSETYEGHRDGSIAVKDHGLKKADEMVKMLTILDRNGLYVKAFSETVAKAHR